MRARIDAFEWSATPIGPAERWPPQLRTAVDICLGSAFPSFVWWGPELTQFYNDGAIDILRAKHPAALGAPAREVWSDAWTVVGDFVDRVLASGETVSGDDLRVVLDRGESPEAAWFTFSYGALRDGSGDVAGIFITAIEITARYVAEAALRRTETRNAFLLRLNDELRALADPDAIQLEAARAVGKYLGAERVGYAEALPDGGSVLVTRTYSPNLPSLTGRLQMDDVESALMRSLRAGQTVIRRNVAEDSTLSASEKAARAGNQIGAAATVPLVKDGRLVAVFFAHFRTPYDYTDDDILILEAVAERTWDAIQRARALDALSDSEERLRLALDAAELGTWTWDLATGEGDIDQRGADLVGLQAGHIVDVATAQISRVHPDDVEALQETAARGIEQGDHFSLNYRVTLPDGNLRHVSSRAKVLLDAAGRPVSLVGTNRDVTAEIVAEEALRYARDESERRKRLYEAVTGNTPDLIYVFDREYRFSYANPALLRLWGLPWEEFIGKRLLDVGYEPWHADLHEREIDQIVTTKQSIRGEVALPHATLGRRIYDYILVPVFDAGGDVEAVAGTTRDITELRRLSLQKDEFIGIISHELRTPVTSVKAYAHILRRRFQNSADDHLVGLVTKMDGQLDKLTELIGDLLDVTRIDLGQIEFKQETFELDRMVTEVVEIVRHTTERHVIERTGTTGVELKGDRERTGQVLTNLISNAIKYSPESDRIIVRVGRKSGRVKIEVQDFGVGLAEQDRLHVFDRFFRVSGPEHEAYPGIGLGLYLSAEIVRRQGGKIGVESTPGTGSTFWFTLPITPAAAVSQSGNDDA